MFVFVCWTPYQIFNAINFVMNNVENSQNNADIYIYHEFGGSNNISRRLKEAHIFTNVYDVEVYDKGKVWYSKFNKIKRLLFPYMTIKKYLQSDVDVKKQGYKTLIISGNNLFAVNLYNAIKGLRVYFIDDGIGSYFGDMRSDDMTRIYRIFNKLFKRGPLSYDVSKIYVNNKSICKTLICENVFQLPTLSPESCVFEKAKEVFEYKDNDQYELHDLIYLSQPYFEVDEYIAGTEEKVLNKIETVFSKQKIVLRLHPRQNIEQFSKWNIDTYRNLWELECVKQINNDNILIGGFSTAQFMPKILVDKEPYVIFLYKIFYPLQYTERWDGVIALFKRLYECPEKVMIPQDVDELKKILLQIKKDKE